MTIGPEPMIMIFLRSVRRGTRHTVPLTQAVKEKELLNVIRGLSGVPRFARQSLLLALFCITPAISAFSYSERPHLVFVEGSLGGGWNSAFNREADIVNGAGPFFWSHDGSYYRYRSSDLMLSAGFGYEFLMLPWVGIRASYAYHSYLSNWTARTGTGRYSRSSVIGGQVAETDGYFIGPVFRYNPFDWPIHFEFRCFGACTAAATNRCRVIQNFANAIPRCHNSQMNTVNNRSNCLSGALGWVLLFFKKDFPYT
jgi:hypothetical protein